MNTMTADKQGYDLSLTNLKKGSVFGALSSEAIEFLLAQGKLIEIQENDMVFQHNEKGDNFFIVLQSQIDYYKQHKNHQAYTRSIYFGEAIGFVSMIALHDRVGNAIAKEKSLLLAIDSRLFSDFHDKFSFDFGILLLNLSREMARAVRTLGNALVISSLDKQE
ncbi:cyclic nucleotide-binding domain-containing protein [Marinomonas epiphytica]